MFDMLQLVDVIATHKLRFNVNLPHNDDKLKHVEHLLDWLRLA
jgi:hypothetical protein